MSSALDSDTSNNHRARPPASILIVHFTTDNKGHLQLHATPIPDYISGDVARAPPNPTIVAAQMAAYHRRMDHLQRSVQAYRRQNVADNTPNQNAPSYHIDGEPNAFDAAFAGGIPPRAPIVITNRCKHCGARAWSPTSYVCFGCMKMPPPAARQVIIRDRQQHGFYTCTGCTYMLVMERRTRCAQCVARH